MCSWLLLHWLPGLSTVGRFCKQAGEGSLCNHLAGSHPFALELASCWESKRGSLAIARTGTTRRLEAAGHLSPALCWTCIFVDGVGEIMGWMLHVGANCTLRYMQNIRVARDSWGAGLLGLGCLSRSKAHEALPERGTEAV
jgi:hypothetical protein